ncbi:hypothetical protein F1880_006246 [Penicillium rolfsii]|nr:hypothetical protein F1880_006246 [Penicillium rolfsii]
MDEPHKASLDPQQECLARVVWAAHILFYLTKTRRHEELPEAESNVDSDSNTDDSSNDDTDYQTEKNTILSGPQDSIRRKFLDCIAQLLSPCKGRDGVTATAMREGEDGVEVDISRNDRFLSDGECFDGDILGYREMLEKYLEDSSGGMNATANSPTDFELKVIDYMSRRVDRWVEDFQKTLGRHRGGRDWNSQRWSGQETAVEAWTTMMDLTIKFDAGKEDVHSRSLLVQQAYNCLNSTPIRELLSDTFGDQGDLRLWNKLKFIARPLVDCRLLKSIAIREPRLRNCKILLVSSESNTILETKRRLGIFQAWERLGLDTIPGPVFQKLDPCSEEFEEACAKTFSLHAEMQLVVHYEERRARWPTLDYFGCSKKTCLLCETVLRALPTPIATRGRHGICYPAWAVPDSKSGDVQVAVQRLEKGLVARIQRVVSDLTEPKQRGQALNIVQSDLVSDFSRFTLEELQRREQHVSLFEDEQMIKQGDLLKMEGIVPATESRYDPVENFEPQNSCVMCNKIPATQCAQCRSIFYCSADCARSDSPSHSLLCKQFATQPDRPSPEYKRAIYFPAERENPCLIWVPCRRRYDEEDGISWTQIYP